MSEWNTFLNTVKPKITGKYYGSLSRDSLVSYIAKVFTNVEVILKPGKKYGSYHICYNIVAKAKAVGNVRSQGVTVPLILPVPIFNGEPQWYFENCDLDLSREPKSIYSDVVNLMQSDYASGHYVNCLIVKRTSTQAFEVECNPAITPPPKVQKELTKRAVVHACRVLFKTHLSSSSSVGFQRRAAKKAQAPNAASSAAANDNASDAEPEAAAAIQHNEPERDASESGSESDSNDSNTDSDKSDIHLPPKCDPAGSCTPNAYNICMRCSNPIQAWDVLVPAAAPQEPQEAQPIERRVVQSGIREYLYLNKSAKRPIGQDPVPYEPISELHFGYKCGDLVKVSTRASLICLFPELVFEQKEQPGFEGECMFAKVYLPKGAIVSVAVVPEDDIICVPKDADLAHKSIPRGRWNEHGAYVVDLNAGRCASNKRLCDLYGHHPGLFNDLGTASQLSWRSPSEFLPDFVCALRVHSAVHPARQVGIQYHPSYWGLKTYNQFDHCIRTGVSIMTIPQVAKAAAKTRRENLEEIPASDADAVGPPVVNNNRINVARVRCAIGLRKGQQCFMRGGASANCHWSQRCMNSACNACCAEGVYLCIVHGKKGLVPESAAEYCWDKHPKLCVEHLVTDDDSSSTSDESEPPLKKQAVQSHEQSVTPTRLATALAAQLKPSLVQPPTLQPMMNILTDMAESASETRALTGGLCSTVTALSNRLDALSARLGQLESRMQDFFDNKCSVDFHSTTIAKLMAKQ